MTARALTPKQERFCQKYIETGNASQAYRLAYTPKNSTDKTIWESASRLLADPKVHARVVELQSKHQKRHEVTVDSITAELDEDRKLARELKQASAAISAVIGKAKLHGLMVEKQETKLTFDNLPDDQLDRALADAATKAGVSITAGGKGKTNK